MAEQSNTGPYLRVAALCEQVVEAKDGRLTLVNMIEQITSTATGPDVPDAMPPFQAQMKAVVALRAGQARGRYAIKLQPEDPSGARLAAIEVPVQFAGQEDSGVNVVMDFEISFEHEGVYWIDVFFVPAPTAKDQLLSRIPLRVMYQPQKSLPQGPLGA